MSDRAVQIRLASVLPKGSTERRDLLKILASGRTAAAAKGKAQEAIMAYLKGHKGEVLLTDLSKDKSFRGIHFAKVMSAMKALAKKDLIQHRSQKGEGDFLKLTTKKAAGVRQAGRHERGLSTRTLDWLVEGAAESAGLDNTHQAEATSEVKALAKKFERDLEKTMEAWHKKNPGALVDGTDVDDLLDDGAAYLVLMTLRGEGAGVWDGDWDHYFTDGDRGIKTLERFMGPKLSQYADDSGTGSLNDAFEAAAYETTED